MTLRGSYPQLIINKEEKMEYKQENGSIIQGKTLIPISDVRKYNQLLERLVIAVRKFTKVVIILGTIIIVIILIVLWKFYSTGYFNHLLARCWS